MAGLCRLATVRGRPGGFTFGAGWWTLTTNPGRIRRCPYRRGGAGSLDELIDDPIVLLRPPPSNTSPSDMDDENC